MSKMPAKKKSCFQITSVTQAQVAASNAADDTESLDDPDESRTEDVSSEIFDVSRADLEPGSCERSSSEETLNNVGDPEVAHPPLSHPHPPLLLRPGPVSPAPPNGGFGVRHIEETVVSHMPHTNLQSPGHQTVQQQGPASVSGNQQSLTNSSTTTTTSCSSRFRVIKLDHGTGEPFRRGRWTCTEFYEKDPEGSVISRTVDSIRHPSVTEQTLERDSGLGGSAVPQSGLSGQGAESSAVVGVVVGAPEVHPYDQAHGHGLVVLPSPQHQHQQQQQVPQGPGTVVPDPLGTKPGLIQTGSHVVVPHSLVPPGHNGMQQTVHIQNSPGVVPSPQSQMLAYQTQQQNPQQLPLGHQPGLIPPPAQVEYGHLAVGQGGLSVAQGPSPVPTPVAPVGGGVQALGVPMEMATIPTGVPLPGSQPGIPVPGLITQHGAGLMSGGVASVPQLGQYSSVNTSLGLGVPPNVSSVPVTSASAGMAPGGNTPAHAQQGQVPRNGTTTTVVTGGGLNQTEEGRRKSEGPMQISLAAGKEPGKPLITEELPLPHPAVNSLFGIAIPIDGDDDRNPSTVFYRAFQPGSRLRDSSALGDSASGASVVAIDNKIEQAMDLVKSHLMYAVREEVEVLKEQIKELFERNSVLERENAVLKSLANSDQLSQLSAQTVPAASASAQPQAPPPSQAPPLASLPVPVPVPVLAPTPPQAQAQPQPQPMPPPAFQPELSQTLIATAPQHQQQQPSVTSA